MHHSRPLLMSTDY